jgi:hypothetical protein
MSLEFGFARKDIKYFQEEVRTSLPILSKMCLNVIFNSGLGNFKMPLNDMITGRGHPKCAWMFN